jgi:hypothetical protein
MGSELVGAMQDVIGMRTRLRQSFSRKRVSQSVIVVNGMFGFVSCFDHHPQLQWNDHRNENHYSSWCRWNGWQFVLFLGNSTVRSPRDRKNSHQRAAIPRCRVLRTSETRLSQNQCRCCNRQGLLATAKEMVLVGAVAKARRRRQWK